MVLREPSKLIVSLSKTISSILCDEIHFDTTYKRIILLFEGCEVFSYPISKIDDMKMD